MSKHMLLSEWTELANTSGALETLDFVLPPELEATEPPEARGLARDGVRLLVSSHGGERIAHARFAELGRFLRAGDVVVINTSGTLPAALAVTRADGTPLELHLSTHLPGDVWSVELRRPAVPGERGGTTPFREATAGETLALPGGASVTLLAPYTTDRAERALDTPTRLWLAALRLPAGRPPDAPTQRAADASTQSAADASTQRVSDAPTEDAPHARLLAYLSRYGFPIRYGYVPAAWPLEYYQTVYTTEPGSAEMPSAGRAFTPELITRLVAQGVQIAPLLLHTGVSSLEEHEPPYEEWYRVPAPTARLVSAARAEGRRVIAVGTTVVRALETVAEPDAHGKGTVHPGEGWTPLVVTPARGVYAVDGLLTGLHEPRASHLAMLEAIAGREHLRRAYGAALRKGYLWHEFGDLHLILP